MGRRLGVVWLGLGVCVATFAACGGRALVSQSGGGGDDTDTGGADSYDAGGESGSVETGTTDPDDTGTDEGGWEGCEPGDFTVPLVRESVMLVYDKSASMFSTLLEDGQGGSVTTWAALHAATTDLIDRYPQPIANLGAELFPRPGTTGLVSTSVCEVSIPVDVPITTGGDGIVAGIPGPNPAAQAGANPGSRALRVAYGHLSDVRATNPGSRGHVIYVTDGAPGCHADQVEALEQCGGAFACVQAVFPTLYERYDTTTPTVIANAADEGVTTYVVGVQIRDFDPLAGAACSSDADCPPGTECCDPALGSANCPVDGTCALPANGIKDVNPREALAAMGQAGAHPNPPAGDFYAVDDAPAIEAALRDIEASLPTCTVRIPAPPTPEYESMQVGYLTLYVGDKAYGLCFDWVEGSPIDNCTGPLSPDLEACMSTGVPYLDPDTMSLTLCGTSCEDYKQAGALDGSYGCWEIGDEQPPTLE